MEKDRDRDPGILLSSIISCVSDLVIQLAEDLGEEANAVSEKGKSLSLNTKSNEDLLPCHQCNAIQFYFQNSPQALFSWII